MPLLSVRLIGVCTLACSFPELQSVRRHELDCLAKVLDSVVVFFSCDPSRGRLGAMLVSVPLLQFLGHSRGSCVRLALVVFVTALSLGLESCALMLSFQLGCRLCLVVRLILACSALVCWCASSGR